VLGATATAALVLLAALLVAHLEIAATLTGADRRLAFADIAPYITDLRRGGGERPDPPSGGVLVAVRAPDGSWPTDTMPPDVRRHLGAQAVATVTTTSSEFVVARRQVTAAGGTWTVWAARDATGRAALGSDVDVVLLTTGLALLAAFAAVSMLIVRGALRPVERLRSRAAALGPDELLPVPPGGDELSRLAVTLNRLVEDTRSSSAHERRLISNAAHELRTPITNLRAAIDLTRRDPSPDRMDQLVRLSDRLGDLAANLLELSRLDEGAKPVPARARDLEDAVLTAVDGWRTRLAGSAVDVDHRTEVERGDALLPIDAVSIGRVVDNLVGNAVKAVGDRGEILVSLSIDASGLLLAVADDGPGMPPALLADAFDRFTRGSASGSGLGLALVRAIAVAGDGEAVLEPLAPGLRVVVTLPVVSGA
jgi:two-component system OmpR family sensor kinase